MLERRHAPGRRKNRSPRNAGGERFSFQSEKRGVCNKSAVEVAVPPSLFSQAFDLPLFDDHESSSEPMRGRERASSPSTKAFSSTRHSRSAAASTVLGPLIPREDSCASVSTQCDDRSVTQSPNFFSAVQPNVLIHSEKLEMSAACDVSIWCLIRLRRWIRGVRSQIRQRRVLRPDIATLRRDKLLASFSDAWLENAVRNMTLEYFFPHELIIGCGLVEDKLYLIHSGKVAVIVGKARVSKVIVQPGTTVGTIGMLTREPRTATVVAASHNCFLWSISARLFGMGGTCMPTQRLARNARNTMREMRKRNLSSAYAELLQPESILHGFPGLFKGADQRHISRQSSWTHLCRRRLPDA